MGQTTVDPLGPGPVDVSNTGSRGGSHALSTKVSLGNPPIPVRNGLKSKDAPHHMAVHV